MRDQAQSTAIEHIRKEVDWTQPSARTHIDRIARGLALEYVNGYLEGGNASLAVYRDGAGSCSRNSNR